MNTRKDRWMRGVIALAAAGLVSCQTPTQEPPKSQAQQPPHVAKVEADGMQRVRVLAGSYFFKPSHIVVKVDIPVELLVSREAGMTPHDLVIKAPDAGINVEQDLGTDLRRTVFTPRKVGKYAIYCSKKPPLGGASHRERGMEGVLEVVP